MAVLLPIYRLWNPDDRRNWLCLPFVIGGIFEVVGYVGRALAYNATGDLIPYILQSVLLPLAPILFAATLYMTLSRVIIVVNGQECSVISTRWLTRFVLGDCFSFLIQASGAGFLVKGKDASKVQIGQIIVIVSLVSQIVIFGIFVATILAFHLRFHRHVENRRVTHIPWQGTLTMLYLTSAAVMVRNVYRTAEYALGREGYLSVTEWPTYVLDSLLMLFTMAAFYLQCPSKVRRQKHYEHSDLEPMSQPRRAALENGSYSSIA
ncbi:RTA1 like protein [Thozetella sp. PMI_491]|nr:RTA1 like protein [Thozetella sp. PMI_491]